MLPLELTEKYPDLFQNNLLKETKDCSMEEDSLTDVIATFGKHIQWWPLYVLLQLFFIRLLYKQCVWLIDTSNVSEFPWRLPKLHETKSLYHHICQWRAPLRDPLGNLQKVCLNSVNALKCNWNAVSVNWNTEQCSFIWIQFLLYIHQQSMDG